jgi:type III pantothenate kinase
VDINLLVMSVGNTRLALGTFVAGKLAQVTRRPHAQREEWEAVIEQAWAPIAGRAGAGIAAASVMPSLIEPLEHAAEQASGGELVEWVGRDIDLPISVRTRNPDKTGVDRVLNMAAAYEQLGKACVVVDAGTAITVDCCDDAGDFLGGAIAPGVAMQLDALHERIGALPRVELAVPDGPIADSTEQAILHGVYHGVRGMVKELTERYATALGSWPEIIATGGDASRLFDGWELNHAVAPDLTLYGIALAYANHHIKHSS